MRLLVSSLILVASGAGLFALAGCGSVSAPVKTETLARTAHLVLINLSDYAWQVRAASSTGGDPQLWYLPARETSAFELIAGDYVIEQTVLLTPKVPGAMRRFAFTPEVGQTYRWRLGTLLSESGTTGEPQ